MATTPSIQELTKSLAQARQKASPADQRALLAMRLRHKRMKDPRGVALNIVPLVDVTFLLMIFFVVAGTLEAWEGVLGSRMLATGKGSSVALPISPVIIHLNRMGSSPTDFVTRVDGVSRDIHSSDELAEVLTEVRNQPGFGADTPIIVLADDDMVWDHVVDAWNAAVRAGFTQVAFGDKSPP